MHKSPILAALAGVFTTGPRGTHINATLPPWVPIGTPLVRRRQRPTASTPGAFGKAGRKLARRRKRYVKRNLWLLNHLGWRGA